MNNKAKKRYSNGIRVHDMKMVLQQQTNPRHWLSTQFETMKQNLQTILLLLQQMKKQASLLSLEKQYTTGIREDIKDIKGQIRKIHRQQEEWVHKCFVSTKISPNSILSVSPVNAFIDPKLFTKSSNIGKAIVLSCCQDSMQRLRQRYPQTYLTRVPTVSSSVSPALIRFNNVIESLKNTT
jgi:hypothetical protein